MEQNEKPILKFNDVRKKAEEIKRALGLPPYTAGQVKDLFDSDHKAAKEARETIAWLAGDFVSNWEDEIKRQSNSYT